MASDKSKKKSKHSSSVNANGTQAPADPKSYQPPEGAVLLQYEVDSSDFDWDSIRDDDDLELWALRVPDSVCVHILLPYLTY